MLMMQNICSGFIQRYALMTHNLFTDVLTIF
jgi:hypothetical protein